jgi:hypothetical protein
MEQVEVASEERPPMIEVDEYIRKFHPPAL